MKKGFIIGIVTVILVAIIGITLAEYVYQNHDLYTGYVYTRGDEWSDSLSSGHEWNNSGLTHKITYQEVVRLKEKGYRFNWILEMTWKDMRAIGIEITDGVMLVILTNDERITTGLGTYHIMF